MKKEHLHILLDNEIKNSVSFRNAQPYIFSQIHFIDINATCFVLLNIVSL